MPNTVYSGEKNQRRLMTSTSCFAFSTKLPGGLLNRPRVEARPNAPAFGSRVQGLGKLQTCRRRTKCFAIGVWTLDSRV